MLGHRGLRRDKQITENSLPAFEVAFKVADGLETDAAVSQDGTVFLVHEISQFYIPHLVSHSRYVLREHLDKKSAAIVGNRRLEQMPDTEIEKLRLRNGEKLPRLSELFTLAARYPEKTMNIELKGEGTVEAVLREINKAVTDGHIKKSQIILTSFDHAAIQKAKQLEPALKYGLIFSRASSLIYPWSKNKTSCYVIFNAATLKSQNIQNIYPDYFVLNAREITAANIALLRKNFPYAKMMFWTSKEKQPSVKGRNLCSDPVIEAVITDYPRQKGIAFLK